MRPTNRGRAFSRHARDAHLLATLTIAAIALAVSLIGRGTQTTLMVTGVSGLFIGVQLALGGLPSRRRPIGPTGWSLLRLILALAFAAILLELAGGSGRPLTALYLPVVAAAAALGATQAIVIGALAALIYLLPELVQPGSAAEVPLRGLALAGVSLFLTIGTRRLVGILQQRTRQLRSAVVADRRRSRQIAGLEVVGRLLASGGPTPELLDQTLGVLVDRFGYANVAIYLADAAVVRLGAQRGYETPLAEFDGSAGVVGRVMRTRELAFVGNVAVDTDYVTVDAAVVSEICAPLMVDRQFLGILNVEARRPLDWTDRDLVATLAGRIGVAVALGRDRQALAERAGLFAKLHDFSESVNSSLAVDRLAETLSTSVADVVRCDMVAVTVLDRPTGRYLLRAATDADPAVLNREIRIGEGIAGRAVRDRAIVLDDQFGPQSYPAAYRSGGEHAPCQLALGIPLVRDGIALGALTIGRFNASDRFRPIELELITLVASHAALALANAFLHADVEELAIRDPLTGLYNRRYFDEALERVLAGWLRLDTEHRRPVSAVMFDVDHFGQFNKLHGHQIGDQVLREIGQVLRSRFRQSDIVARFGGEEFVAVLDGSTLQDAVRIAEEVRMAVSKRVVVTDGSTPLTVSISAGCASLDPFDASREQLLRTADVALFMAKRAGRDRVVAA